MAIGAEEREQIRDIVRGMPLSEAQINQLKLTFVAKEDCENKVEEVNRTFSRDFARFGVLETKVNLILGIISAIGIAFLSLIAKQLWGL